jgi:hypothetical protein
VAATAANLAGWHDAHLRSLGVATEWTDGAWLARGRAAQIFFAAIAIRPGASPSTIAARLPADRWQTVSDPWRDVDLGPAGFLPDADREWMARTPDAQPAVPPTTSGLEIGTVMDADGLVEFEQTEAVGFGAETPAPHAWHGPELLADPRFRFLLGRVDGFGVAVAMAFHEAGVAGIYSVATVPRARRRGYGTALTWRAVGAFPGAVAVLQPSTAGERIYRRLGFAPFTTFRSWTRAPRRTPS